LTIISDADFRYHLREYSLSTHEKSRLSSFKYFIVANLHNNERILEYFFSELIFVLKMLISLTNDPSSIYVSIYESASVDLTPVALQSFAVTLDAMEIPHTIISNPNHKRKANVCTFSMKMSDFIQQPRIDFLADVRNRAISPIHKIEKFDVVLFFNDIYFCKNDVLRLLLYNVDMACAMDFDGGFRDTWVSCSENEFTN
jgi:hypothetical protein